MHVFKEDNTSFLLGIAWIAAVVAVGVGGYAAYRYNDQHRQFLSEKISLLEHQIVLLSDVVRQSNVANNERNHELRELFAGNTSGALLPDDGLVGVVSQTAPAVASIVISKEMPLFDLEYQDPLEEDPFFRAFDVRIPTYKEVGMEKQQIGAGTGFIIRSDGYILTNRHVVDDMEAEYAVLLSTGEQKAAKVVYRDKVYDFALLKIEGGDYTALSFGDSSSLQLGQTVIAIGNALGEYNNSVSVGIISGLDRTIRPEDNFGQIETLEGVIQTDAAINMGNSGGPLLDMNGNVVGINVAIESFANAISFALPINEIKNTVLLMLP